MRKSVLFCCLMSIVSFPVFCQTTLPRDTSAQVATESPELRAARHSFMLVSTRAVALFHSADTIEARLQADGSTLRPSTTALRLRIEHTLDQTEDLLKKEDVNRANDHIKLAEELVSRFERRIGAE